MKLVFVGPTIVPLQLEDGQIVRRGQEVDVDSDLAERLLEQTELDPDKDDGSRRPLWARPTTKAAQAAKRTPRAPAPAETPAERIEAGSPAITPPDSSEEA